MLELSQDGAIHMLRLTNGENLIDGEFFEHMNGALDEVEKGAPGDAALVITGEGKFFCNGLDLPALSELDAAARDQIGSTLGTFTARLLTFPIPTVAALNGHAFAGGAILATACDYRVMREDRGWICFSEVDVNVPFTTGLSWMIRNKLTPQAARAAIYEGKRFTGHEALAAGFVDELASEGAVVDAARELIAPLATKNRATFATLKARLWLDIARELGFEPVAAQQLR